MGQESRIEKKVSQYARDKGCYVRKFKSPNNRGVPDKLFLTPHGFVFFIEFKAPGKLPTALQQREMNQIREHGGFAYCADSIERGKEIIDVILEAKDENILL